MSRPLLGRTGPQSAVWIRSLTESSASTNRWKQMLRLVMGDRCPLPLDPLDEATPQTLRRLGPLPRDPLSPRLAGLGCRPPWSRRPVSLPRCLRVRFKG
jgi:hypothetical protein